MIQKPGSRPDWVQRPSGGAETDKKGVAGQHGLSFSRTPASLAIRPRLR
jgi:hypothetical protein